jgi:BlaI family transcriptional regulator, penicillinase repressor
MRAKQLTKAEEQVMHYMWDLGKGFLKDIVDRFPMPKPAYTTVSTVIRVLVKKEFLGYHTYGKAHEYYPLISKSTYLKGRMKKMLSNYFDGSPAQLVSYFANEPMNISELQEIKQLIEIKIRKLKTKG